MRRFTLSLAAVLVAGCLGSTDESVSPTIPDGTPVYRIVPSRLVYEFSDNSTGNDLQLRWLTAAPAVPLIGYNCLGMLPNSAGDTVGTFIFAWNGPNTGTVERYFFTTVDTAQAFFFPPEGSEQGTSGNYVVNSAGQLTLNWANGMQSRYFQPTASLTFVGDTIVSDVDIRTRGDSVREQWHVVWALEGVNGC